MNENLVSKSQAIELKELGFDEECFGAYHPDLLYDVPLFRSSSSSSVSPIPNTYKKYSHQNKHVIKAPFYDQAIEWLSEKADTFFIVIPQDLESEITRWNIVWVEKRWHWQMKGIVGVSVTRQDAKSSVVDHLIKIIKTGK